MEDEILYARIKTYLTGAGTYGTGKSLTLSVKGAGYKRVVTVQTYGARVQRLLPTRASQPSVDADSCSPTPS